MHGTSTADWLTIGPDGTATLDVRSVLLTDRYRWLNRVQAVAKGVLNGLTLTYEVCEVR